MRKRNNLLWAPWRMKYIRRDRGEEEGCLFCRKGQSRADLDNYVICRSSLSFALLNTFPYNNGHLLVAPYRHTADLIDLRPEETADLMAITRKCVRALKEVMEPDGFNIGLNLGAAAGAGVVDHLHLHIVPRWQGDTNFMPVIAGTDVIPQSLQELYRLLTEAIRE